jgi:hypothetical protein
MEKEHIDRVLETVTWGALFIWWGLSLLPNFLPNGLDAAGTGLILPGLNFARRVRGIPANSFSLTLGVVTLVWGALDLPRSLFHFSYKLPVFAILMILLGVTVLVQLLFKLRKEEVKAGA